MIRITANTLAATLTSDLARLSSNQSRLTQQMASGKRLIDASDDVPATGRVMSYESEKRMLQQFERNAQRGLTDIKVSTAALNSMNSIGRKVFNLAPAAAMSGDPAQHAAFASQIDGLIEQVYSLSNTQVGGNFLFGDQETSAEPFTAARDASGRITGVTYNPTAGSGAAPEIAVSENARVPTLNNRTQNQELEDFLNNLVALRDAVAADNEAAITTTQNTLGDDLDNITSMLSTLSTSEFRIKVSQEQNSVRFNQLADLAGGETEVDLASTIVKYQASERSYQAALQAGSKILQRSLLDYL